MSAAHSPSRVLKDLGIIAVLGHERAARDSQPPASLLSRAAAAATRARAGRHFHPVAHTLLECPPETHPPATPSQAALLNRLLASPDSALIHDWCTLARAKGVGVPTVAVPSLLDWWARQPHRSPEIFEATGACGVWLAELNSDWQKPAATSEIPPNADDLWQTGSSAQRVALLVSVRRNQPARALEMVQATWNGADGAEDRRKFIEVLGQGVSRTDESFLESALGDRSKAVRREAARVLTGLAGSALRTRMRERAHSIILAEKLKPEARRSRVKIELPAQFQKDWERDGIEEQAVAGKGKRASWMLQILSATDLALWTELSGQPPSELLQTLGRAEFFDDALRAIIASMAACPAQPDVQAWGDAIITQCADRLTADDQQFAAVCTAQSSDRSEAIRLQVVSGAKALKGEVVWQLLVADERPWSLEFSTQAAAILRDATPKNADKWNVWGLIEVASHLLHPGAADLFDQLIASMFPDGPSDSVRRSLDRIRLRAELHREFQS